MADSSPVEVVIEVPRGSRTKRAANGSVDFVSPVACPFNYGSVPALPGDDGEPVDALVLGPMLPLGHRGTWPVHGVVRFIDGGVRDDKLICGASAPTPAEERRIRAFFRRYARVKALMSRAMGRGPVRFEGLGPW